MVGILELNIIKETMQGFVCEGAVGEDVVKLLERAIFRHPDMDIEVCRSDRNVKETALRETSGSDDYVKETVRQETYRSEKYVKETVSRGTSGSDEHVKEKVSRD